MIIFKYQLCSSSITTLPDASRNQNANGHNRGHHFDFSAPGQRASLPPIPQCSSIFDLPSAAVNLTSCWSLVSRSQTTTVPKELHPRPSYLNGHVQALKATVADHGFANCMGHSSLHILPQSLPKAKLEHMRLIGGSRWKPWKLIY